MPFYDGPLDRMMHDDWPSRSEGGGPPRPRRPREKKPVKARDVVFASEFICALIVIAVLLTRH
jgi:hypothetical protein